LKRLERTNCKKDESTEDDLKKDATVRIVAQRGFDGFELTNGKGDISPIHFFKRGLS
jgi:hypothetical protein